MENKDAASSDVGETSDRFNESGDHQSGDIGAGSGPAGSEGKGSDGDTTESGNSSMEKKYRVAISEELKDMRKTMQAMISSMKAAGEARKRVDEAAVKYNLPEIGCSKKETDAELHSRLDNLKMEHYRTEDCINSALERNAGGGGGGGESISDIVGKGSSASEEKSSDDDDFGGPSTGSGSANLEHGDSSDDIQGLKGGSDEKE